MSVGVWNENANHDESAEMLKAVKAAQKRAERLKALESRGLGNLVETAKEFTPDKARKAGILPPANRPVGGSRTNATKFPHRDTSVQNGLGGRNCRIITWDSDIRHIEYTPVNRYKLPETDVPARTNQTGTRLHEPEQLAIFRDEVLEWWKQNRTDTPDEGYISFLADIWFAPDETILV